MGKARDIASAAPAPAGVTSTELGYVDGVTSAIQTQINSKIGQSTAINPSTVTTKGDILVATGSGTIIRQGVGTDGQVLTADSAQADGVAWTTLTALPSQTGNAGKFLTTNGTAASWGSAGVTWTQRTNALTSGAISMIAFNGTNLYVAVGSSGLLLTSPDAITWTSRTSTFGTDNIIAVSFANNLWVIGGAAGKLATSTDGINWTARTSQFGTNAIYNVKYVNSLWFALGAGGPNGGTNSGGLAYSSDGATWTRATMTGAAIGNPTDIEFVGSTYVIGASGYGASNIGYTTNLNSGWSNINPEDLGASAVRLFWNGSAWIYTSNATNGTVLTSTATPPFSWTSLSPRLTTDDFTAVIAGARVSGSTIYSLKNVGTNNTVIMSTPWAITSGRFNSLSQSIPAPVAGMYAFNTLCVNASNQFVVADTQGRIYTSF